MRISTAQILGGGIAAIQNEQAAIAKTQQQLSTGRRITRPSDDPGGAVESLRLQDRIAATDQYTRNGGLATSRLQQEESALKQMGDALQRVRELTVQAANATQTDDSRAAIAQELRQISAGLLDTANTRDANGEYLFAGYRSTGRPFATDGSGSVQYLGDGGQRFVSVAPNRDVAVGDSGRALMSIPRGNGVFAVTPAATNTGTGSVTTAEVTDPAAVTPDSYTIQLTAPDAYDVLDSTSTVIASGTYTSGQAIDIGGRRIVLSGQPAAGDSFAVDPTGTASVFEMVNELAAALETPRSDAASRAQLDTTTGAALQNLDQALGRVLALRTDVGARLSTIDTAGNAGADQKVQLQTTLSGVQDLDYAEAISRLTMQQTALQAAQQTFVQVSHLSLFDYIR
jgi:flagellar hook-associated protein 3 FlgL